MRHHRRYRARTAQRRLTLARRSRRALPAALATLLLGLALVSVASALVLAPAPHKDPHDVVGGPLDLTSVTFGQQDTFLTLTVRTANAWATASLTPETGQSVCLQLTYGRLTYPRTEICVAGQNDVHLTRSRLDALGHPIDVKEVPSFVGRADSRSVSAQFAPLAANLGVGRHYRWRVVTTWTSGPGCSPAAPCVDYYPNGGPSRTSRVALLAEPRCFGAASRDPVHRCANPALRKLVIPTPDDALITPYGYCAHYQHSGILEPCTFGVPPDKAKESIALIGDSHAQHWRGALEVVAQGKQWAGYSLTQPGCALTQAVPLLHTPALTADCKRFDAQIPGWLADHPEVHAIFVSAHDTGHFAHPASQGFRRAWSALPRSVRRVYVIRDTPHAGPLEGACVERAIAHHALGGTPCARPRAADISPDAEASAAAASQSPRVRLIDLTRYFCDPRVCFSIVGGVLVRKDGDHMTRSFATTIGPYLLRAVDHAR